MNAGIFNSLTAFSQYSSVWLKALQLSSPTSLPHLLPRQSQSLLMAMSTGRVYALLISTPARQVVFERFYDSFTEPDKAEIRAAFDQLVDSFAPEVVGRYKNGKIVLVRDGELLFFALGTGEYNELALAEILRILIATYKETFRTSLSDAVLLQNFGQTALVVDELCKEGIVDLTDSASIQKAIAMRLPTEGGGGKRMLNRLFSSADKEPAAS